MIKQDNIENFLFLYKKLKTSKTKFIDFTDYEVLKLVIINGAYKILKFLITKESLDFNIFSLGESLPFLAVKYQQYEMLELMLKHGADPNKKFQDINETLLSWLLVIDRYKGADIRDLIYSDKYFNLISQYGGKRYIDDGDYEDEEEITFDDETFFIYMAKK